MYVCVYVLLRCCAHPRGTLSCLHVAPQVLLSGGKLTFFVASHASAGLSQLSQAELAKIFIGCDLVTSPPDMR